ncbi:diaminopropionate ammonia-lyase [Limibacillus sp. MBR-115]|uniref:diaminopropionate ammonia-lyase n=1 Tax=Limibacillus sp. MBR-115 TaxID=3156465 RepID=UPI003397099C
MTLSRTVAGCGRITDRAATSPSTGSFPAELEAVLSSTMTAAAQREITTWPGYEPTPLRSLNHLAEELQLAEVLYKDESPRFGLGSFKALGGSYAVVCLMADLLEAQKGERPPLAALRSGALARAVENITVVTATDGNHGRSVAWGAQMVGCACRIYIHAEVSKGRQEAMEALGAEVVRIDGDYDASLRRCAEEAAANGWYVVSDTSYEGYMDLPRNVMAGYSVMAAEVLDQIEGPPPSHVFIQAGVGGVAAAVCATFWQRLGAARPRFVIVEPATAACILASARAGRPATVPIEAETIMAGLSCGEASLLAWDILSRGAQDFLAIEEQGVESMMRLLASGEAGGGTIEAGESAVPGLVALVAACRDRDLRRSLGLDDTSRVLVFGCEGATDPAIYQQILAGNDA